MRKLFASLLSGWVAQSREIGQINGYLGRFGGSDRTRLIGSLFLLSLLFISVQAEESSAIYQLNEITYSGAEKTRESTLHRIARIDSGSTYNDSLVSLLRHRLERSDLFESIVFRYDTLPDSTVTIAVKLAEKSRFYISDIGGSLYGTRYGEPTKLPWIRANLGVAMRNIAGTGHKVTFIAEGWRIWKAGFLWEIPLPAGFFVDWGSTVGGHPSRFDRWHNNFDFQNQIGFGRHFSPHFLMKLKVVPRYTNYKLFDEEIFDDFWEVMTFLSADVDYRDSRFNPHRGTYFSQTLITNALLPYKEIETDTAVYYTGGITDIRGFYNPGGKRVILAGQVKAEMVFDGSLSRYNRLYLGGTETVRGFASGAMGGETIYNNRITGSAEVRFPIYSFKDWNLAFLSWYDKSLQSFSFDLAGTVFITGGHIWKNLEDLGNKNSYYQTAMAAGLGLRIHFPSLKMSACGELGWPIYAPDEFYDAVPTIHGYINLPF